jgi:hypothetical protein
MLRRRQKKSIILTQISSIHRISSFFLPDFAQKFCFSGRKSGFVTFFIQNGYILEETRYAEMCEL